MPVVIIGTIEDVQTYEGKSGFGATITMSHKIDKRTKRISFNVKDKSVAERFENLLDTEVTIQIELVQNNFGLRFGELIEVA